MAGLPELNNMMKKQPLAIIALLVCLSLVTTTNLARQEPLDGRHRVFRDAESGNGD